VRCRYVPKAQHALGFPASPRAGLHLVRPGVICEGKSGLNKQKNSPTFRMVNSFGYEARLLRTEAVTIEIGSPRAQIAPRDQWLWSKGFPSPFCSGRRSRLACPSQGCGGGGGIRTCDQGLMSSWLPSLRLSGGVRLRPVSGGKTPSIEESGCRRTRTINREQRLMDVEMDVEVVSPRTVTCRPSKPITARPSSPPIICTILPSTQS